MTLPTAAASKRFIILSLAFALLAQIALYWPTLHQLPFGDDWGPPLSEINRGKLVGPLSFFTETRQPDSYRPLQSLLIWAFGRIDEPGRWVSIRILHFLSSALSLVVLGLLVRQWKFGRAGVIVAAAVGVFHPALVAPVGSIDGFSSILSDTAVWWGVWMMAKTDRVWVGIGLAALAMIVGTLVKEYAFAMGPTAVLAAWFFYRPRWRAAIYTAVTLGILTAFLLWVRKYTKPTDMGPVESDFDLDSLWTMVDNAVLVPVGGFFFGDSLWLYVTRNAAAIAVSAGVVLATAFTLIGGLLRATFSRGATLASPADASVPVQTDGDGAPPRVTQTAPLQRICAVAFLILSIYAVTFPANTVMRISEMYLCGVVFTVALLAGLAADGWARDPSRARRGVALALGVILAASAVAADRHKISAMVALGQRTRLQTDPLVAIGNTLPDGAKIALLYRQDQVPPRGTFSSFRLPDKFAVRPPARDCLWLGRKLTLLAPENALTDPDAPVHVLPDLPAVMAFDRSKADVVLYWDVDAARFTRLK